jgi:translocation and assembly module TamA
MRFMVTDSIEAVGFYEGARVTRDLSASGEEKFRWGTGLGARYHTAIGPIRVDVAVPIDRRDVDDPYQFYISLGQAF